MNGDKEIVNAILMATGHNPDDISKIGELFAKTCAQRVEIDRLSAELESIKTLWHRTITGNQYLTAELDKARAALAETVRLLQLMGVDKIPEDIRVILDDTNDRSKK